MKVLLTGFEAFNKERINPASRAVLQVEDRIAGAEIVKEILPTEFGRSIKVLEEAMAREEADIIICVGQAGGRYDISMERIAMNLDDAAIPDNAGKQPIDETIFEDGENAYFSNLPIKAMASLMRENNIPASISNTAGSYVCNHIMYALLYLIDKKYEDSRGGFIHVPYIREQVIDKKNMPFMEEEILVKALELAVIASLENEKDIKEIGGKIF